MIQVGMTIADLDTPCVLVDLDRLEANIQRLQTSVNAHKVKLRPHMKTHKIPAIAHMQLAAGAVGITVAKVAEAEIFAAHGCTDIVIAYPVIGEQKWRRIAELARTCTMTVGADSEVGIRGLSAAATKDGVTIRVRIEIDTGFHRCGVQEPRAAERLCRLVLSLPMLELDGITTHRGSFFPGAGDRTPVELAKEEGELIVSLAERLRTAGIAVREVVVGSTPTGPHVGRVAGVTEICAGTYVFGDCMMAEVGAIDYNDIALSILCTVVSRPLPRRATVDGGSKTFSGDSYPTRRKLVQGFGKAVGVDAYLESLSEEHGLVHLGEGVEPEIGSRMAFTPMHVCTAVNLAEELVCMRNGAVEKVWPVLARGKRT